VHWTLQLAVLLIVVDVTAVKFDTIEFPAIIPLVRLAVWS